MKLPTDTEMKLAANGLIHKHGAGAEEYVAQQLWNARQRKDKPGEAQWISMREALKAVRELRATITRES